MLLINYIDKKTFSMYNGFEVVEVKNTLKHIWKISLIVLTPFLMLILFFTGNFIYVWYHIYRGRISLKSINFFKIWRFDFKILFTKGEVRTVGFSKTFPGWMTLIIIFSTLAVIFLLYRKEIIALTNKAIAFTKRKISYLRENSSKARIARLEKELEELKKEKEPIN